MARLATQPRLLPAAALWAAILLLGSAAQAAPIVFYDGPDGFGVSEQTALGSGLQRIAIAQLDQAQGLDVSHSDPFNELAGPPGRATVLWSVENNRGIDALELYLVFARPLEHTIVLGNGQSQLVDYAPEDVGLDLQNASWVLFEVPVGPEMYYYPAVSLGSLGDGQSTASPFQMDYVLNNPQIFLEPQGFELGLPNWQLLSVLVPIPEPSTALLVGAGVAALAAGRRRRP